MTNAQNTIINHVEPIELIDWLAPGESCELAVGVTRVQVRLIGRKGRRARISVSATPGTSAELVQREVVLGDIQSQSGERNRPEDRQVG